MHFITLPNTELTVSRLCYGTGPLKELSDEQGADLLLAALDEGVNLWDTSDDYDTHRHVRAALAQVPRKDVVVISKISDVFDPKAASAHVDAMLEELDTDYLDVLLLHHVDTRSEWDGYMAILEALRRPDVHHVGLSSHQPDMVRKAAQEPAMEVVMAPLNYDGLRIKAADRQRHRRRMEGAMNACRAAGKGLVAIKVLGGGELAGRLPAAVSYAFRSGCSDVVDIGMANATELAEDIAAVNGYLSAMQAHAAAELRDIAALLGE